MRIASRREDQEMPCRQVSAQDVHDGGVADALDVVVIGLAEPLFRERHESVHHEAHDQHARHVAGVVVAGHGVEEILEPVDAARQRPG